MSKKKNTLKDLDEFLRQQAATIVPPETLSPKVEEPFPVRTTVPQQIEDSSPDKIIRELTALAHKEGPSFRQKFYDIIIQSLESSSTSSPEDKMLINTALYLKSGSHWKEAIREYWRGRK